MVIKWPRWLVTSRHYSCLSRPNIREDSMKIFCFITYFLFVAGVAFGRETGDEIQSLDYEPDIEPYESLPSTEKPIFKYQKNGIKLDLKIVPSHNDTVSEDHFPNFPAKDIGGCVLDMSLTCVQRQLHHFLDKIRRLKEITLLGNWVKLVRTREPTQQIAEQRSIDTKDETTDLISRDIDSFFDVFALRIDLPSLQGKKKKNQIEVMFDETGLVEGRGKKGGKGGGKCKKMMMMMLMMVKMKMMGMMGMGAMKGMMMAGMSLMISKWMLIQKLMEAKKGGGGGGGGGAGPWQGGGGGGGGGGTPLKEIILVTKASGGGGGGGGSGGASMDSYGAPPPSSSYGAPGGGHDSGGGGWGRSLDASMSASNFISRIVSPPVVKETNESATVDGTPNSKNVRGPETQRMSARIPVYESSSPVYEAKDENVVLNSSDSQVASSSGKNRTHVASSLPQSKIVTLHSSYQIAPVEIGENMSGRDSNVQNPIYVSDWKNFELAKRWTANHKITSRSDQVAERTDQEYLDRRYDYGENHQPYGRLIKDRNAAFHGV